MHQYIDKAEDAQIAAIYTLLADKAEAVQGRISIEQYNKEIDESEQEMKQAKRLHIVNL